MIVLDTNIVSEFMTAPPSESVLRWLTFFVQTGHFLKILSKTKIGAEAPISTHSLACFTF